MRKLTKTGSCTTLYPIEKAFLVTFPGGAALSSSPPQFSRPVKVCLETFLKFG
jgi:hypothetical protein